MKTVKAEMTPLDVKRARHPTGTGDKPFQVAAGGVPGLLLVISPAGAKSWMLRTMIGGARKKIGLGPYPEVSLADARTRAKDKKEMVWSGVDPIHEAREARAAVEAAQRKAMTFDMAVAQWMTEKDAEFKTEKRRKYIAGVFKRYASPHIGRMHVQDITVHDMQKVFLPIWTEKHETAKKLRERVEAIMSWARVKGHRTGDNPAAWRGNLALILPKYDAEAEAENQPAVSQSDMPRWWRDLAQREGMGAVALRFLALTCARSGMVRSAVWSEIDLQARMWTIPKKKMKMKRDYRIPLPAEAVAIVRKLKETPHHSGSDYVFPAVRGGMLSDMSISKVMRTMQAIEVRAGRPGYLDEMTGRPAVPHGLRSTFRDWAGLNGIDRYDAEIALAHKVGSATERAYLRADMLERRRAVSERWADFINGKTGPQVIQLPARRAGIAA